MLLKSSLLVSVFFSMAAWGIVTLPPGNLTVEGKIIWENKSALLIINPNSLSQVSLVLEGDVSALKGKDHANAVCKVHLDKAITSSRGKAHLLSVKEFLHPAHSLKEYIETKGFK